jgi:hypothetical protein
MTDGETVHLSCCRACSQLGSDGYNSALSPASMASTPRLTSATSGGGSAPPLSAGGRQEAPAAAHYLESQLSFRVGAAAAHGLLVLTALYCFCWLSSCFSAKG